VGQPVAPQASVEQLSADVPVAQRAPRSRRSSSASAAAPADAQADAALTDAALTDAALTESPTDEAAPAAAVACTNRRRLMRLMERFLVPVKVG